MSSTLDKIEEICYSFVVTKWFNPCHVHYQPFSFSPPQSSGSLAPVYRQARPLVCVKWTEMAVLRDASMSSRSRFRQLSRLTPQVARLKSQATVINLGGQGVNLCGEPLTASQVSNRHPLEQISPCRNALCAPAFFYLLLNIRLLAIDKVWKICYSSLDLQRETPHD